MIEAQQEQIEFLQNKLAEIQEIHEMGRGERKRSIGDSADSADAGAMDGAYSEPPVIPPAPPPPPIDGVPTFGMLFITQKFKCLLVS